MCGRIFPSTNVHRKNLLRVRYVGNQRAHITTTHDFYAARMFIGDPFHDLPRCGKEQSDSDACINCHIVIEKYFKYLLFQTKIILAICRKTCIMFLDCLTMRPGSPQFPPFISSIINPLVFSSRSEITAVPRLANDAVMPSSLRRLVIATATQGVSAAGALTTDPEKPEPSACLTGYQDKDRIKTVIAYLCPVILPR